MDLRRKKSISLHPRTKGILFFVACCIFVSIKAKGQSGQGCYVAVINKIYTPNFLGAYLLSNEYSTVCPAGSTAATPVFQLLPPSANLDCLVVASGTGTVLATGKIRSYVVSQCPLDDYLPLLLPAVVITAIICMRSAKGNYFLAGMSDRNDDLLLTLDYLVRGSGV